MKTLPAIELQQPAHNPEGNAIQPQQSGTASSDTTVPSFHLPSGESQRQLLEQRVRLKENSRNEKGQPDNDDNNMQALMAIVLAQHGLLTQNDTPAKSQTGVRLQTAASRIDGEAATILQALSSLPSGKAQTLMQLTPALQKQVLALASQDKTAPTPHQQGQLAKLHAEDVKNIGHRSEVKEKPQDNSTLKVAESMEKKPQAAAPHASPERRLVNEAKKLDSNAQTGVLPAQSQAARPTEIPLQRQTGLPGSDAVLSLNSQSEEWGQKLTSLLKDRIHFQIGQQQQISTIRLDPPSLGKLEISVQLDSSKLVVHINASQADIYRNLQQLSDQLRHSLMEQNFVQVQVQVSADSGQQHQQQEQDREESIFRALDIDNDAEPRLHTDPLIIKV